MEVAYWAMLVAVGLACGFQSTLASSGSAVQPAGARDAEDSRSCGERDESSAGHDRLPDGDLVVHAPGPDGLAWRCLAAPICRARECPRAHSSQKSWQTGRWASSSPLPFLWPLLLFTKVKQALARERGQMPKVTFSAMALLFGVGFWLGFIVLDGATCCCSC